LQFLQVFLELQVLVQLFLLVLTHLEWQIIYYFN
jgi:hypothetical protein